LVAALETMEAGVLAAPPGVLAAVLVLAQTTIFAQAKVMLAALLGRAPGQVVEVAQDRRVLPLAVPTADRVVLVFFLP
jgi:hypothetical protein